MTSRTEAKIAGNTGILCYACPMLAAAKVIALAVALATANDAALAQVVVPPKAPELVSPKAPGVSPKAPGVSPKAPALVSPKAPGLPAKAPGLVSKKAPAVVPPADIGPRRGEILVPQMFRQSQAIGPLPLPSDAELARVTIDAELLRLAHAVGSEEFALRASARSALVARKPTPDELMALLLRRDLNMEASNALVAILRERILTAPRGALGIRMEGMAVREKGVRISGLVPGMPGEKALIVGDVVASVNDEPLLDRNDLIRVVQSLAPGVEVKLVVHRTERDAKGHPLVDAEGIEVTKLIDVALRLGSTDDLVDRADPLSLQTANPATAERQATATAAAERFLPKTQVIEFVEVTALGTARAPASLQSVRQFLMESQLNGADALMIRGFRKRLDAFEQQERALTQLGPDAARKSAQTTLQIAIEELDAEIRSTL